MPLVLNKVTSIGSRRRRRYRRSQDPVLVVVVLIFASPLPPSRAWASLPRFTGVGTWGNQPCELGLTFELRVLDWHWPRGDPHIRYSLPSQATVAYSINRARGHTVFAVMCRHFPPFHAGRVWFAWWLFPIPNANNIWPQFRNCSRTPSPFPLTSPYPYSSVHGMTLTCRTSRPGQGNLAEDFYGVLSMAATHHWNFEMAYLSWPAFHLLVLCTPSFRFAVANLPGWHTTIFPPYLWRAPYFWFRHGTDPALTAAFRVRPE